MNLKDFCSYSNIYCLNKNSFLWFDLRFKYFGFNSFCCMFYAFYLQFERINMFFL